MAAIRKSMECEREPSCGLVNWVAIQEFYHVVSASLGRCYLLVGLVSSAAMTEARAAISCIVSTMLGIYDLAGQG